MKSFILIISLGILLSLSPPSFLLNTSEQELKISNPPKVSEIFNIKTHKVYDIQGNLVDLSLYDRVCSIISFYGPNKEHIIVGGLGARDVSKSYPYDDSYFEKNCIIRSVDGGQTLFDLFSL